MAGCHLVVIELREPFTVGMHQMVGNQVASCDFIPATTLRGAIASALTRKGRFARLAGLFGGTSPRWSPAWPKPGKLSSEIILPMPFSFLHDKDDPGLDGKCGVVNALECEIPRDKIGFEKLCRDVKATAPQDLPDRFHWVRMAQSWLKVARSPHPEDVDPAPHTVNQYTAMHVALDYGVQSARPGALFSRAAVPEGLFFAAYVVDPDDVLQDEDKVTEIFLGKRRTSGNGAAALTWKDLGNQLPPFASIPQANIAEATIQILSPAIIPGPNGGYFRGLDSQAWGRCLGSDVEVLKAFSSSTLVQGWSGSWDLPRERTPAVAAGSCYKLRCTGDEAQFSKGLQKLVEKGLGIRTGEGFGWIAVNPPWLMPPFFAGNGKLSDLLELDPIEVKKQPSWWPPASSKQELIPVALKIAAEAKARKIEGGKLKDLAIIATRVNNLETLKAYVDRMGDRRNARGWDEIKKLAGELAFGEQESRDMEEVRFILSWASVFGKSE